MNQRERRRAAAQLEGTELRHVHGRLQGEAYVLHAAVEQQRVRLGQNTQPGAEWMADQRLFAEALRGLMRAAETALLVVDTHDQQALEDALETFRSAVPDVISIRDALEHFDDYILGVGKRSRVLDDFSHRYSRGEGLEVHVGDLALNIDSAAEAATDLASAVLLTKPRPG